MGIKLLSISETEKELTEKMLSGWKMLNTSCPITGYPLVEKNKEVWNEFRSLFDDYFTKKKAFFSEIKENKI